MEPIISFKDFSFTYRTQKSPTLHDINLNIFPGEKVLIVGPSGSGKSTLAHLINGLVPFAYEGKIEGSYLIKGQDPSKLGIFGLINVLYSFNSRITSFILFSITSIDAITK